MMNASSDRITVLLLEDNPRDAVTVQKALTKAKDVRFTVEQVRTLAEAVARLARGGIDVVVTDLAVPDSQGLDTFVRLHTHAPDLPIVVLTGTYEDERLAIQALQQGAQDYLIKGEVVLHGILLTRVLRHAIERKRIEEELKTAKQALEQRLTDVAWLSQVAMDRERLIVELKQELAALREHLSGKQLSAQEDTGESRRW